MDLVTEVKRAVEFTKNNEFVKAERIYKTLLKDNKDNPLILSFLGLLYLNMGLYKKAEKYLTLAYQLQHNFAVAEGLALTKYYLSKETESIKYFEEVIDKTKSFDVFDKYVNILLNNFKHTKALTYAKKCYELFPLKKESILNLVYSYMHVGEFKEAFSLCEQLVKQYPKYGEGWLKLGLIYEVYLHDEKVAKMCYQNVLKYGDKEAAYYNLAVNANKTGDYDKALEYLKKLKKTSNIEESFNFSMAVTYFKKRMFKKAYQYYVKKEQDLFEKDSLVHQLKRLWDGKVYKDEILLIFCDQGVGDCIMFARYIPYVANKFKRVKVLVRKSIVGLYKRSFKGLKNVEFYTKGKRFPHYDKSVVLSNLPYYLKMPLNNIPSSKGYMIADAEKISEYQKRMQSNSFKVGICWEAGSAGWRELLNRTLNVSFYESFFNIKNIQFYSLQVNPSLDNYKKYSGLIDLGTSFKDFDDTAGAIKNLDLVITVDTSVAHLAGALGVKTFMLLPYCPDWRWFDNDNKTEWYDSIKIFKQKNTMSWDDVIDKIEKELYKRCIV